MHRLICLLAACAPVEGTVIEEPWLQPGEWEFQLSTPNVEGVDAEVLTLDLFDTPDTVIETLRSRGQRLLCWISAGTWEPFRADADDFAPAALGERVAGFEEERWLDVRHPSTLNAMRRRIAFAAERGCDAVQLSSLDGYEVDTGFALGEAELLAYTRQLLAEAESQGLAAGITNGYALLPDLASRLDFAVFFRCFDEGTCGNVALLRAAGRPVFHVEALPVRDEVCALAASLGLSPIFKPNDLGPPRETCPGR